MHIIDSFFLSGIENPFDLSSTFVLNNDILLFKLVNLL